MTIEEKARAYDEALERARFYHGNCPSESERKKLERMFPVLRKSEDERIRKELIEFLREAYSRGNAPEECAKWLVWLDRPKEQKEQEPVPFSCGHENGFMSKEWGEKDKKLIDDVINSLCCYQNTLSDYQKEIVGEEIRKLKSLKPQPKQEWGEDDEAILSWCISDIQRAKHCASQTKPELCDIEIHWLESLKPRWKPSDEQMEGNGRC